MQITEREIVRLTETAQERGDLWPATYERRVTLWESDSAHTYCTTRFYRNNQCLNVTQDGNYAAIRRYLNWLGVADGSYTLA